MRKKAFVTVKAGPLIGLMTATDLTGSLALKRKVVRPKRWMARTESSTGGSRSMVALRVRRPAGEASVYEMVSVFPLATVRLPAFGEVTSDTVPVKLPPVPLGRRVRVSGTGCESEATVTVALA